MTFVLLYVVKLNYVELMIFNSLFKVQFESAMLCHIMLHHDISRHVELH